MSEHTMPTPSPAQKQRGFTVIEVMISIAVLSIGLLSLLGVIGMAITTTQTSQEDMTAKQLEKEAMESVFTARDTANLGWTAVNNVANGGVFLDNVQNPVAKAGPDGIFNDTPDGGPEYLDEPGTSGVVTGNCATDKCVYLGNFSRKVTITNLLDSNNNVIPTLRCITITITYTVPQTKFPKTYVLTSYISQYR